MKDISWIFSLKNKVPVFLKELSGKKRSGFYHYSLSGDYFGEKIKWGLGNSVFFLKIIYTLGLEKKYSREVQETAEFIKSFQRKDGLFSDFLIAFLSLPSRAVKTIKDSDFGIILNNQTARAETRQAISSLSLFQTKPNYTYNDFPKTKRETTKYLANLNWRSPWGAGSHFSHLLFFLHYSSLSNKKELINHSVDWVNQYQCDEDGFWYKNNPSPQQKINGTMKVITGLKVINKVNFKYAQKIIDNALLMTSDKQACDNFNIVYVLKCCGEITKKSYRFNDIIRFMFDRLDKYKEYYYPNIGGFSFNRNKAGQFYYGALVSRGKNEPDIHGTVMFLWGISIIAQVLGINKKLGFKEFIS